MTKTELTGSEKQIAWAQDIITGKLAECKENLQKTTFEKGHSVEEMKNTAVREVINWWSNLTDSRVIIDIRYNRIHITNNGGRGGDPTGIVYRLISGLAIARTFQTLDDAISAIE